MASWKRNSGEGQMVASKGLAWKRFPEKAKGPDLHRGPAPIEKARSISPLGASENAVCQGRRSLGPRSRQVNAYAIYSAARSKGASARGAAATARSRHADAQRQRAAAAVGQRPLLEFQTQPVGNDLGLRGVRFRQQHRKLVAADPRDDVRLAAIVPEDLGRGDHRRIAGRVAEPVVDALEPIEVDEQERERPVVALEAASVRLRQREGMAA